MSHVIDAKCKIHNLAALQKACKVLGLQWRKDSNYSWYGVSVGDFAGPKGADPAKFGKDAEYVISLNEDQKKVARENYQGEPYEIGVCRDPENPSQYVLRLDFWNSGYGLCDVVGAEIQKGDDCWVAPKLVQQYHKSHLEMTAAETGDELEWKTLPDGTLVAKSVPNVARLGG